MRVPAASSAFCRLSVYRRNSSDKRDGRTYSVSAMLTVLMDDVDDMRQSTFEVGVGLQFEVLARSRDAEVPPIITCEIRSR